MSDPRGGSDSDRDSLTGWTLVDREGTPEPHDPQQDEKPTVLLNSYKKAGLIKRHNSYSKSLSKLRRLMGEEEGAGIAGGGAVEDLEEEEEDEEEEEEDESGCGMEEDEGEEDLPEDLVHMGQHVQEVKASSGSDSSDIETLEAPGPEEFYQDHCLAYDSLHSSLSSSYDSSLRGFAFVRDNADPSRREWHPHSSFPGNCDSGTMVTSNQVWLTLNDTQHGDADVESLASTTDISVLDDDKDMKDSAAMMGLKDDETDLSLASSPSLPEDLPAIKPDRQYQHTPSSKFNGRLNTIVMLTIATVCGLAIGHFLGWSSRSLWQDSVNSAQVRKLRELQDNLVTCINHGQDSPFGPSMSRPIKPSISETAASLHHTETKPSPHHISQPHFTNPTPAFKDSFEPETMIHMASDLREDVLGYESLVESIIQPLEDAGVVVGSNVQRIGTNHYHKLHNYENRKLHRRQSADEIREKENVIRKDDSVWMGIDFELPVIHDSKLDLDSLDSDPIFPKPNMDHKWLTEPVFEDHSNDINSRIKTASEITFDSEDIFITKVSKEAKPEVINHPKKSPMVDFVSKTNLPKKYNTISQSKSIPSVSDLIPDNDYEDDYLLMPLETYKYVNKYEELPEEHGKENIIISEILDPEEYEDICDYEDITESEIWSQYENIPCSVDNFPETSPHYNSKNIPSVSDLIPDNEYEDGLSEAQIFINDDLQVDNQLLHTKDSYTFSSLRDSNNFITLNSEIEELTLDLSQDLAAEMPAFVDLVNNQIIDALAEENQELSAEMTRLQQLNLEPIKIQGKSAKESRTLRERISRLISENEELRVAVSKMQFNKDTTGDKAAFATLSKENQQKRVAVSKLTHLVPDLKSLKESANILQVENEELRINVGKLRYEQPMPRELNALTRELDSLKQTVKEAEASKKTPENLDQAKKYVSYMTEVMAALNVLSEFGEGSIVEKMDVAADFFEELVPVGTKIAPAVKRKIEQARAKFGQLRTRLGNKWEQIKTLSKPDNIKSVGTDTLGKMNRVVVNVVNKMKEIGHTTLMKKGKAASQKTATAMADGFAALDLQFDKTWKMLQLCDMSLPITMDECSAEVAEKAEIKEPVQFEVEMKEVPIKPVEIEEEEEEEVITAEIIEEEEEVEVVAAGDLIRDEPVNTPAPSVQLEKEEQEKEVLATKIKKSKEIKEQKRKEKEEKKLEKEKKKKEREADKQKKKEEKREIKERKGKEKKGQEKKGQEKKGKKGRKDEEKQDKKEKEGKTRKFKESKKENKKVKINNEDDKPYYKGQYNKNEKPRKVKDDDDDDDEDDDDDDNKKKRQKTDDSKPSRKIDEDDSKQADSKMKQRWSKPGRYNMRQENVVSNSKFIKRMDD